MSEIEGMIAVATAPVWVPIFLVYAVGKAIRSGVKGTYRAGQRLYGAYATMQEARAAALSSGQEAVIVEADPTAIVREYKLNSEANRIVEYDRIMKKPTGNTGLSNNNLKYRNAHQNSLLEAAGYNLGGGRRTSKRSTKRRRNGKRSSARR